MNGSILIDWDESSISNWLKIMVASLIDRDESWMEASLIYCFLTVFED
jgi:hypothetical protein